MAQLCANRVDHAGAWPLLAMLGRRGRWPVIQTLRAGGPWTVRGLAAAAGVAHQVAGRAVRELEALGAAEFLRPGRDAQVRWRGGTPAGRFLEGLDVPDLRGDAARAFQRAVAYPCIVWSRSEGEPHDPLAPTRVAVVASDADEAIEDAARGLDAVAAAGLPRVDVSVLAPEALESDDPVARRIRAARRQDS